MSVYQFVPVVPPIRASTPSSSSFEIPAVDVSIGTHVARSTTSDEGDVKVIVVYTMSLVLPRSPITRRIDAIQKTIEIGRSSA